MEYLLVLFGILLLISGLTSGGRKSTKESMAEAAKDTGNILLDFVKYGVILFVVILIVATVLK